MLHLIPLGEGGTDRYDLGPLRADYLLHTMIFIPWMFLISLTRENSSNSGLKIRFRRITPLPFLGWMALGILLAFGAEAIQYWIDYRAFNPMDGMFNALGVVLGALVLVVAQRFGYFQASDNEQAK